MHEDSEIPELKHHGVMPATKNQGVLVTVSCIQLSAQHFYDLGKEVFTVEPQLVVEDFIRGRVTK